MKNIPLMDKDFTSLMLKQEENPFLQPNKPIELQKDKEPYFFYTLKFPPLEIIIGETRKEDPNYYFYPFKISASIDNEDYEEKEVAYVKGQIIDTNIFYSGYSWFNNFIDYSRELTEIANITKAQQRKFINYCEDNCADHIIHIEYAETANAFKGHQLFSKLLQGIQTLFPVSVFILHAYPLQHGAARNSERHITEKRRYVSVPHKGEFKADLKKLIDHYQQLGFEFLSKKENILYTNGVKLKTSKHVKK